MGTVNRVSDFDTVDIVAMRAISTSLFVSWFHCFSIVHFVLYAVVAKFASFGGCRGLKCEDGFINSKTQAKPSISTLCISETEQPSPEQTWQLTGSGSGSGSPSGSGSGLVSFWAKTNVNPKTPINKKLAFIFVSYVLVFCCKFAYWLIYLSLTQVTDKSSRAQGRGLFSLPRSVSWHWVRGGLKKYHKSRSEHKKPKIRKWFRTGFFISMSTVIIYHFGLPV